MVGCKWIYKIKTRSDESIERYKTCLVAKGFTQEYGIDYEETFAPVARISSVRALLAVVAASKWDIFHEPHTYREASTDPLWQIAMKEELDALSKNHTWEDLVTFPLGKSVVGCKWIYKIQTCSDGSIKRYKARLGAKGFMQEYGIDYEETFAPVIRALLAVAAAGKWDFFSDECQKCIF